jgi:hypothetical protein
MNAKNILAIVMTLAAINVLSGCGALHDDRIATCLECSIREDCIRDLRLADQPEQYDILLVVDPTNFGNVELCAAKALKAEFKGAKILFESKGIRSPYVEVQLTHIEWKNVILFSSHIKIDYAIILNGKIITGSAQKDIKKGFWNTADVATNLYLEVCPILAKQIRVTIEEVTGLKYR